MLLKIQPNKINFRYFFIRQNISQLIKRNDNKSILNYITGFDAKNIKRKNDFLEFLQSKFHENANSKNYLIYKSNSKLPRLFLGCLCLLGLNIFLFYFLLKSGVTNLKLVFLLMNLFVFYKATKSQCWQLKKFIRNIELSKDLNKVFLTTYKNKIMEIGPEEIILKKNSYFYIVQYDFLRSICVEINVKGDNYYVQLDNALIPDKDILSASLKGYKLKKLS
jgi:hypothetical protein